MLKEILSRMLQPGKGLALITLLSFLGVALLLPFRLLIGRQLAPPRRAA